MNQRLETALAEGATIVTAGRRLARTLAGEYNEEQRKSGAGAWACSLDRALGRLDSCALGSVPV